MKNKIFISILSFLIGIIIPFLLLRSCDRTPDTASNITSDTVFIQQPAIIVCDTMKIPKPYLKTVYKTEFKEVDTAAIIAAYYTENRYNPSYKDSNIELKTDIAVFNNELKSFSFNYEIYQKEKIITNTYTKKEMFSFSLGLGLSYNIKTQKVGGVVVAGTNFQHTNLLFNYDLTNKIILGTLNYKFLKYSR